VLLSVDFGSTDASHIPTNERLWGITSIAGANGINPSGYAYQNGIQLASDNKVRWYPQYWYEGQVQEVGLIGVVTSSYLYHRYYERTDISEGWVTYTLYIYASWWAYENDHPSRIYTWEHEIDDSNFLVGNRYNWSDGHWYKFFQFGVESVHDPITATWEEFNKPCYYDYDEDNWWYRKGKVCWSSDAWLTWWGTGRMGVGLEDYTGVGLKKTSPDLVYWEMDDPPDPVSNGASLWTQEGIVSDLVSKPYQ